MNDSKCCHSDPNSGARQSTSRESSRTENATSSTLQQHSKTRNLLEVELIDLWVMLQRIICRLDHRSSRQTTFSMRSMHTSGDSEFFAMKSGRQCAKASRRSPFRRYSFPNTTVALL